MRKLNRQEKYLLEKIKQVISAKYNLYKIYYHGSRVKGNANEYSDYDVLIILKDDVDWKIKDKIYDLLYDIELENDVIIDTQIYNQKEITSGKYRISLFVQDVMNKGIVYE